MSRLNTTVVCDCGHRKSPHMQYCNTCWSALDARHSMRIHVLGKIITDEIAAADLDLQHKGLQPTRE